MILLKTFVGAMRTKAEWEALSASSSEFSHSFLTESQRAALDAALAAKQTAPGEHCHWACIFASLRFLTCHWLLQHADNINCIRD